MKKVILILALVFTSSLTFGQSMFDKLEDLDEVSTVVVTKDAFEILSKFKGNNEAVEVFNMIQELEELKMFSTEDAGIANQMESMVQSAVKKSNLTELMRVKDKGSRVKIYVKSTKNKDYVSEVLMYIRDKGAERSNGKLESLIVSLTGNIDINKMSKLADTFSNNVKVKVTN